MSWVKVYTLILSGNPKSDKLESIIARYLGRNTQNKFQRIHAILISDQM